MCLDTHFCFMTTLSGGKSFSTSMILSRQAFIVAILYVTSVKYSRRVSLQSRVSRKAIFSIGLEVAVPDRTFS